MFAIVKRPALLLTLLMMSMFSLAQDLTPVHTWKVTSKRVAEGSYELRFTATKAGDWQVYAPNQLILEIPTTELKFEDSSIIIKPEWIVDASKIAKTTSAIFETEVSQFTGEAVMTAVITIPGRVPSELVGELLYTYGKGDEFNPATTVPFTVALEGGAAADQTIKVASIDLKNSVTDCGDDETSDKSALSLFLLGLLGGLIALLTPCVFPMIPVTVTFFTKKSEGKGDARRNAILYGLFIFLIYVLITIPFHVANKAVNPEIFNNISTNVWMNLIFFAIFIVFALSFFGLYEIGLPSSFANRTDSKSSLGNIGGIFFMALTLAIVSFSCTGPIFGVLLVGALGGDSAWPLTAGAAGFGVALGLPFALFAMFPKWLQSLPKSGGWMTDVKVVLGFVEVALAIKFLSNADLVEQWGLVKREIFIGLWVIIGVLIVLYLTGKLKIGHSSPVKRIGLMRGFFISLFAAFTIYLIPGLTNTRWADLRLISGFPPPRSYSLYKQDKSKFQPIHNDFELALRLAKEQHKPILIDFTGWACVNCRRMEENVWPDPEVNRLMRDEFIVVSLYVDERTKLPADQRTTAKLANGNTRSIITIGDKWSTFQTENFGATSQPQYAIISADQVALTKTKFYTTRASEFAAWLRCGVEANKGR